MALQYKKAFQTSGRLLNKNKFSVVFLFLVLAIGMLFYKKIKSFLFPNSEEEKREKEEEKKKEKELTYIHNSGTLRKPNIYYKNLADNLETALDFKLYMNMAKEIRLILSGLNDAELIQVYKSFGLRYYKTSWWNPQKSGRYDLFKWFQLRLEEPEITEVKNIFKKTNLWG